MAALKKKWVTPTVVSKPPRPCEAEGCTRNCRSGRYCDAHQKRLQRTGSLGGPIEKVDPESTLAECALSYADAVTDEEFIVAKRKLQSAALEFAKARGYAKSA